jgi:hypothetical protein
MIDAEQLAVFRDKAPVKRKPAANIPPMDPAFDFLPMEFLSAGLETDIEQIRSAASAIPASAISTEEDWMRFARAFAHEAAVREEQTEPLYEILDAVSRRAPGYDEEDNRHRFERYKAEAFNHDQPITIATIFHLAMKHGWLGWFPENAQAIPGDAANANPNPPSPSATGAYSPRAVRVSDLPSVPPKRHWLHGTDLIRGAVSVLVAPGGRAKSSWLLVCALACASSRSLLGSHVFGGPLRVLVLSTEDGMSELTLRLRAAMKHHKLTDTDVPGLFIIGADRWGLPLLQADKNRAVLDCRGMDALIAELDYIKPDVLIIDPLINALGGVSVSDNAAAALLMSQLVTLAAKRRISVALAHHASKGRDATSAESAMGAASFMNLARIGLSIETLDEKDAGKVGLPSWEAKSVFRVIGTKQNFTPPSATDRWFRLVSIEMTNAEPPIYTNGDNVAVVEHFQLGVSGPAFPPQLVRDALLAVDAADPPLSRSKQATERYAVPVIAEAIAPHRGGRASDTDGKALLDHLIKTGLVRVAEIQVSRPGSRSDTRKGLKLTSAGRKAAHGIDQSSADAAPQSPQSPRSPDYGECGQSGRGPLSGSPAPQGGYGGECGGPSNGGDAPHKRGDNEPH